MNRVAIVATALLAVLISACGSRESGTAPVPATAETGGSAKGDSGPPQGEPIKAVLTSAAQVPPPIKRKQPAKVIVELEVKEIEHDLRRRDVHVLDLRRQRARQLHPRAPGRHRRVPPAAIIPTRKMPHNIDLHAVTGPGGGAASSRSRRPGTSRSSRSRRSIRACTSTTARRRRSACTSRTACTA